MAKQVIMKSNTLPCTEQDKIRALPWLMVSVVLTSMFTTWTFNGSIFLLYLSELGLPKGQIGAVLSLFPFCGVLALVFAPAVTRSGWKRVFLLFYGLRNFVMALLLLLPWVLITAGHRTGLIFLFAVIIAFALFRAMAETAYFPWSQEFTPKRLLGRVGGISTVLCTLATCMALWIAGFAIGHWHGLTPFLILLGAGCILGFLGVVTMVKVPGGEPRTGTEQAGTHLANMMKVFKDHNFVSFLAGNGCVTFGSVIFASFMPLYVKEQMCVASGTVVMLDGAVMVGAALSGIISGWMADRIGSRPVLMPSAALFVLIPLGWLLLPRQIPNAAVWCAALYFLLGIASSGVAIGAGRLLLSGVIPQESNTAYWAIYYAWSGGIGGLAVLLTGVILSACAGWQTRLGTVTLDGHSLLFILALVLLAAGWWLYGQVRPDDRYTTLTGIRELLEPVFTHPLFQTWR